MDLLAIDPGSVESGYVLVFVQDGEIISVLKKGKISNKELLANILDHFYYDEIVIEMIASYGMPVGKEVFETCLWTGRFIQADSLRWGGGVIDNVHRIYRKDEKLEICGSVKAKDSNIRQALVDIYAPGQENYGKGTKSNPGFFYGFKKDIWQAFAVAHTYVKKDLFKYQF